MTRREEILARAGALFSSRGYHATSMRDLARELGIQGGSLYAHIEGKEELLWEIVNRAADEFDAALAPVVASSAPPPEKLRLAVEGHLEVVARNKDLATVFFNEWKHLSPERYRAIALRRNRVENVYREIFAEGIKGGQFRKDLDPKLAAVLVLSGANWAYQWFNPQGRLSARQVADAFVEMLLEGFER